MYTVTITNQHTGQTQTFTLPHGEACAMCKRQRALGNAAEMEKEQSA
jgi:hypothetical protein